MLHALSLGRRLAGLQEPITEGKFPRLTSVGTLTDSIMSESGTTVTVTGSLTMSGLFRNTGTAFSGEPDASFNSYIQGWWGSPQLLLNSLDHPIAKAIVAQRIGPTLSAGVSNGSSVLIALASIAVGDNPYGQQMTAYLAHGKYSLDGGATTIDNSGYGTTFAIGMLPEAGNGGVLYGASILTPDTNGNTPTTIYGYHSFALGGFGVSNYPLWFDEQGVYRVRADNTFNSVYQAIPALYNPLFPKYTPAAANYERIVQQWNTDVAEIGTEKGGTGTLRALRLIGASYKLAALTSNGFVKTSGGDGTLSVDTASYQTTLTNSAGLRAALSDENGTGAALFDGATSPTFVTPVLGVAAATSINKVTITAPATGSTLTLLDGKTFTVNKTLTLTGTDSTTMTFPTTSATLARTDAGQTFTGNHVFSGQVASASLQPALYIEFLGGSVIRGGVVNGNVQMANNAENSFGLLQLGGVTSSFPALKRSTTTLQVRLADDSAYARIDGSTFRTVAPIQNPSTGGAATTGNAVLVGGTVTVSTTAALTGSSILLTRKTSGGTIGTSITYTISNATSFTITSDNILDTSTFTWVIVDSY